MNLADNQEFENKENEPRLQRSNDDEQEGAPSFLKPLENIPWGGLKFAKIYDDK